MGLSPVAVTYNSNQAVFSTRPKSKDKNLNIFRMKKAFKMKEKAFLIISKGLQLNKIKQIFWEGESLKELRNCIFLIIRA